MKRVLKVWNKCRSLQRVEKEWTRDVRPIWDQLFSHASLIPFVCETVGWLTDCLGDQGPPPATRTPDSKIAQREFFLENCVYWRPIYSTSIYAGQNPYIIFTLYELFELKKYNTKVDFNINYDDDVFDKPWTILFIKITD